MTTPTNAGEPVALAWRIAKFPEEFGVSDPGIWNDYEGDFEARRRERLLDEGCELEYAYAHPKAPVPSPDPYPWLARGAIPPREPLRPS